MSLRGNEVRIVEERQNAAFARTLRAVGAVASRHFYDEFRTIQHHTYEPRSGASLLEWVTRELALIDVAVAVAGIESELCRWLANVSQEGLARAYLTFDPDSLTDDVVAALELERFDLILALDRGHVRELRRHCPEALRGRIQLLGALVGAPSGDVPDPYYQDLEAFEQVFDLLDGYCLRLLSQL